jgi:hypothetical protein
MSLCNPSRVLVVACLLFGSAMSLAAVKPITTTTQAARAVASTLLFREDAQSAAYEFSYSPRDLIARLMGEIATFTTFQALLQTPGAVVLNCPLAGTLSIRLSKSKPRVLRVDSQQCSRVEFSSLLRVTDGPAEVVLLEDSFTPAAVASIRFGDLTRDHVETFSYDATQPDVVNYVTHRNLRVTGYLPLRRLGDNNIFAGRYLAHVIGFHRSVTYMPDYASGDPGEELYPFDYMLSSNGALLSGESFNQMGLSYGEEVSIVAGDFNQRHINPSTPTNPGIRTVSKSFGGTGLRLSWGINDTRAKGYFAIDGVARMDYSEWWGFGCPKADEFSYRTRTLLEYRRDDYTGHMFDSGKLTINGNTTATFTASGTVPYVDRIGHVALDIPGLAPVSYDVNGFIYGSELTLAGYCTP